MRTRITRFGLAVVCVVSSLFFVRGQTPVRAETPLDPANMQFTPVTGGLSQPVFLTHAGDGSGRLFVLERAGRIRIVKNGDLLATPFLDIDQDVKSSGGEQGLLALAFHPNYASNGLFYTVHTADDNSLVLSRFSRSAANPDLANAASRVTLLSIPHPGETNHNGGVLAFGPDEYLYWSTGDGGGAGDQPNNAQNLTVLLGKILRLDVDSGSPYAIPPDNPFVGHPTAREEIWAYGLRNPWKFSFDRQTGDLYIGDVGQGDREEIDFQPAGSAGGENYGWRVMEGSLCFSPSSGCDTSGKVLPVAEYDHDTGCSVTGGYVYRGSLYPALRGHYFYGDFCTGALFSLEGSPSGGWTVTPLGNTPFGISTFGEDEAGELYLADYGEGEIYQVGYAATTFADVPATHIFYRHIEALHNAGITSGCAVSPNRYCPDAPVTRGEMAVFLERAMGNFTPAPSPRDQFGDVPAGHPFAPFIDELYNDGITSGCSTNPLLYCPAQPVTRGQMAVFILRAVHGSDYAPSPSPSGMFGDVSPSDPFKPFIEQLYNDGITSGCSASPLLYCPGQPVTRGEMAVFLVRAFGLPMP